VAYCATHFNTAFPSTSISSWRCLCFRFYDKIFLCIAYFSRACNMLCPTHLPTLDDLNNICRTVSIVKLITMLFYLSPSPHLPLLQIFPSTSVIICLCRICQSVCKFPCSSHNPEIRFPIHISQPNSIHSYLKSLPLHSLSKRTLDKKYGTYRRHNRTPP
jgi:hypothetical protein